MSIREDRIEPDDTDDERIGYAQGEALAWDRALLSDAIAASGLSVRAFALMLTRESRTVFRWLSGESPVPRAVKDQCRQILEQSVGADILDEVRG